MNKSSSITRSKSSAFSITREQAAWLAELSLTRFDEAIRPMISAEATRKVGARLYFSCRSVVAAIVSHRATLAGIEAIGDGARIPAKERLQAAQASIAELKLQEMRGTHVDLSELKATWRYIQNELLGFGEFLQQHGNERLLRAFNDKLDNIARSLAAGLKPKKTVRDDNGDEDDLFSDAGK